MSRSSLTTRGGSTKSSSAPKRQQPSNRGGLSDPRFVAFLDRSRYEAFHDPYRGIFPYYQLSFNDNHSNNDNNQEASSSGEKVSPWTKCRGALCPANWQFNSHGNNGQKEKIVVSLINNDDNSSDNNSDAEGTPTITMVECDCPSVNEWAQGQLAAAQKRQMAELKKKKKKKQAKKSKKKAVVVLDGNNDDNDEQNDNGKQSSDISLLLEDTIICGTRTEGGNCACDYNPFCLASLGGILDEYRYNLAHAALKKPEGMDITTFLRENWTNSLSWHNDGKESQQKEQTKNIRGTIHVDREHIQTHLLHRVCCTTYTTNLPSAESCMDMIQKHQSLLQLQSNKDDIITNDTTSTSQLQLSKPPGLRNLGSTCYLNSQLQCLAQNIGFVHGLFSWKPSSSNAERMNHVLSSMQSILARMRIGGECIIDTNEFALALGLDDDEMQDPNEFAGLLSDRMQDSFRQCAITSGQTELNNLLPSIYWGKSSITTKCCECGFSSKKIDDFKFLALPIVDVREANQTSSDISNTKKHGPESNNRNTDVQQLLNLTLHPESLEGDNQYFCSVCNKKCNATRTPYFENLPPVLNLQLNRYIFNMESYTKQKLTTKVCLPHVLEVPYLAESETEKKTYVLVAVQNHLGNSAHGGHYVADVMDWSTGVWFEFNDEDVAILQDGPTAGFHLDQTHGTMPNNDKPQKNSGSADAYNLFYVEKDYLSTSVQNDMIRCDQGDSISTFSADIETTETEYDTYQLYSKMRMDMYRLEQDEQAKKLRQQSRLDFRREQLIKEVFCSTSQNKLFDLSQSSGSNVLVDSKVLKQFFSCTDGMADVFKETLSTQSILKHKSLRCQHHGSSGVHPSIAAKLKLLPLELFDIIYKILTAEYTMFMTQEAVNEKPSNNISNISDLVLKENSDLICKDCSTSYQAELRQKFTMLENLITVYKELRLESNDLGNTHDLVDACAISKWFITSYYKYVDGVVKTLFSTNAEQMPPGGDLLCLDFTELTEAPNGEAADKKSSGKEVLDATVNSMITCKHDRCNMMHNQRSTRIIPKSLWTKIELIFPEPTMHAFQPPMDECIGNCRKCFLEKQSEEHFPIQIKEWKSNIESNSTLSQIFHNHYIPTVSNTTRLNILHHNIVQGWREAYSYLLRSKKNVSNETVKQKLLQLLFPSSCSLRCNHQKTMGIPNFSTDNKQTLCSLKEANLELFSEKDCSDLVNSLAALEKILQRNSDTLYRTNLPLATMAKEEHDIVLIHVEPEICNEGCMMLEEDCVKLEEEPAKDQPMDIVEVEATPKHEDEMFNMCVHEVEGGVDLEVAVSTIFADLSSQSEEVHPRPRRSRRKKTDGEFPSHSLQVPHDCNLAHFRLLVHEKIGKRLQGQSLYYAKENASAHENGVIELLEKDNSEDFKSFISDANPQSIYHILMTYKDLDIDNELDNGSKRIRKRLGKVDMEAEDNIMFALTELAFRGKSDENYIGKGRKAKKQREERGFRGTFLHSSSPSPCIESISRMSVNGSAGS